MAASIEMEYFSFLPSRGYRKYDMQLDSTLKWETERWITSKKSSMHFFSISIKPMNGEYKIILLITLSF